MNLQLTKEQYAKFWEEFTEYYTSTPNLRVGQAMYIALSKVNEEVAHEINGETLDPFYLDEKVREFLKTIKPCQSQNTPTTSCAKSTPEPLSPKPES